MKNLYVYLMILMFIGIVLMIFGNSFGTWLFVPSITASVLLMALNDKK
jgi:hypothetical protein